MSSRPHVLREKDFMRTASGRASLKKRCWSPGLKVGNQSNTVLGEERGRKASRQSGLARRDPTRGPRAELAEDGAHRHRPLKGLQLSP